MFLLCIIFIILLFLMKRIQRKKQKHNYKELHNHGTTEVEETQFIRHSDCVFDWKEALRLYGVNETLEKTIMRKLWARMQPYKCVNFRFTLDPVYSEQMMVYLKQFKSILVWRTIRVRKDGIKWVKTPCILFSDNRTKHTRLFKPFSNIKITREENIDDNGIPYTKKWSMKLRDVKMSYLLGTCRLLLS